MPATFQCLTPVSAFAANKLQFVLDNASSSPVWPVVLVIKPWSTVVTGVAPGLWTLRRRNARTTAPSGTGGVTIVPYDTANPLAAGITAWNAPSVAPAGGTLETFDEYVPQADEQKLSTLDAPTMGSLQPFGGVLLYDGRVLPTLLALQPSQTLELVQSATAGTGNCRVLAIFATVLG